MLLEKKITQLFHGQVRGGYPWSSLIPSQKGVRLLSISFFDVQRLRIKDGLLRESSRKTATLEEKSLGLCPN
jgi:hypothetical protein